jgi:hypothetical protein
MVVYHSYVVHMIRIHSLFSHRKELIGPINQSWNMSPISNPYEKSLPCFWAPTNKTFTKNSSNSDPCCRPDVGTIQRKTRSIGMTTQVQDLVGLSSQSSYVSCRWNSNTCIGNHRYIVYTHTYMEVSNTWGYSRYHPSIGGTPMAMKNPFSAAQESRSFPIPSWARWRLCLIHVYTCIHTYNISMFGFKWYDMIC